MISYSLCIIFIPVHKKSQQSKKELKEAKAKAKKAEEAQKSSGTIEENSEDANTMEVSLTDKENADTLELTE